MLWLIGFLWLLVVGGFVLEETIRLELWIERAARHVARTTATVLRADVRRAETRKRAVRR